jgi:hypothetical protein
MKVGSMTVMAIAHLLALNSHLSIDQLRVPNGLVLASIFLDAFPTLPAFLHFAVPFGEPA